MPAPTPQAEPTTPYDGLTFLQLQTRAAAWFGMTTTDMSAADLIALKALLNEAIARINMTFPGLVDIRKLYSITTTAAQASYSSPVGLIHIFDPIILDGEPVYSIPTEYENRLKDPDISAAAQNDERMYAMDWGVDNAAVTARPKAILTFYPAPTVSGTAQIWGTGHDNALSGDTDIVRLPRAYTFTPVYHAVQPFLAERGRQKDLAVAVNKWNEDLGSLAVARNRQRTRGETTFMPNAMRSGRGRRYPGTYRVIP